MREIALSSIYMEGLVVVQTPSITIRHPPPPKVPPPCIVFTTRGQSQCRRQLWVARPGGSAGDDEVTKGCEGRRLRVCFPPTIDDLSILWSLLGWRPHIAWAQGSTS